MSKFLLSLLFASIAFAACAAGTEQPRDPFGLTGPDIVILSDVATAVGSNRMGEYLQTMALLGRTKTGPTYQQLSPKARYIIDVLYGQAAYGLNQFDTAHDAYLHATEYEAASESDWFYRFETAVYANNYRDANVAFTTLRNRWRDFADHLDATLVYRFERGLLTIPKSEDAQLAFETHLYERGWLDRKEDRLANAIRFHYAQHLIDKGDTARAARAIDDVTDPHALAVMHADKRFDTLLASNPEKFDVASALNAEWAATSSIPPRTIFDVCGCDSHAAVLYQMGRFGETLNAIDAAFARVVSVSGEMRRENQNFDTEYNDALTLRSLTLFALGRRDEAVGVASALQQENCCGANTEMPMLMGRLLIWMDRGKEASDYLMMVFENNLTPVESADLASLHVCAATQTHGAPAQQYMLADLRKAMFEPGAVLRGYVCANDLDGAASAIVEGLADPQIRPLMLDQLQIYQPDGVQTEAQKAFQAKFDRLRSRPDVLAAVAKVGRINHYPLVPQHWFY